MSSSNKYKKEGLRLALTQLPVAVATLGLAALLLLSFYKTDFAAWIFVTIFTVIGCVACVFFSVKTHKVFVSAKEAGCPSSQIPTFAFVLAVLETVVTLGACAIILAGTLYPFLYLV